MSKRFSLGAVRGFGLQASLLCGLGAAFVFAPHRAADAGDRDCVIEGNCTFRKPNLMIIVDYSSSMNQDFGGVSRWQATADAISEMIDADNGFLGDNLNLGLVRFGHDPVPEAGTLLVGDTSNPPITDGQALDVHWYDPSGDPQYIECNGENVKAAIQALPPPLCDMNPSGEGCSGIGTWTKGALDYVADLIAQSRADHGEAVGERLYLNLVLTDGSWTGPDGSTQDASEDPSITAADLFDNQEVPTYVVAVSSGADQALADELALAGGTLEAIDGSTPADLVAELQSVVEAIKDDLIVPECVDGMPRIMIILDASSSMLNTEFGAATIPGQSGWDQAREALAGEDSIFDVVVSGGNTVEDLSQLGLIVFGNDGGVIGAGDEEVLVDYGPCMKDNFAWALDPENSCVSPGCTNPYAGPPIEWTKQDGSVVDPMFHAQTISHMPACELGPDTGLCLGSGTFTQRGLALASNNQEAYAAAAALPDAPYPAGPNTAYINILITDGNYMGFSTDALVRNELQEMFNRGIVTYVIGFGEFEPFQEQLDQMQSWGSGGVVPAALTAADQAQLQMQLDTILSGVAVDPCCGFNDCSENPEPTAEDPETSGSEESGSEGEASSGASGSASAGETGGFTSSGGDGSGASGTGIPVTELGSGCGCTTQERAPIGGLYFGLGLGVLGLRRRRRARSCT